MAEVDGVIGNDDKMRGEAWRSARAAFDALEVRHPAKRKDRGRGHHAVKKMAAWSIKAAGS
jgi:threonylcarbamoyladenosine tRNA methylthiotransferase MtaB